jgi:hypothetical protein
MSGNIFRKSIAVLIIAIFIGASIIITPNIFVKTAKAEPGYEVGPGTLLQCPQRKLARTSTDDLYVVYQRFDGIYNQIYIKKSTDNGQTWGSEEKVHDESTHQDYPLILIDSQDTINVIWKNGYGADNVGPLYLKRKVGGSWESRELISNIVSTSFFYAVLDANDNVHVLYSVDSYGTDIGCKYKERVNGVWSNEEMVSYDYYQRAQDIIVDSNGNIHAFFISALGQYYVLKHRERTAGSWGPTTIIGQTDNYLGDAEGSAITDNVGDIHVVWAYGVGPSYAICHRKYSNGGWQPDIDYIGGSPTYFQVNPSISTDSNNNLHVVWFGKHSGSPTYFQVRHCKYDNGWGTVENLTNATIDQMYPNLISGYYPEVFGKKINRPYSGYAFVWNDGPTIRFYKSPDLSWEPPVQDISIDIKPGSYPNSINPKSNGKLPVAILTTEDFDASEVDPDSIDFLSASPLMWAMKDVDYDGDIDMILHFKIKELNFNLLVDEGGEYPYAYLYGETYNDISIEGKDTVRLIKDWQRDYKFTNLFNPILEKFPVLQLLLEKLLNRLD